MDRFQTIYNIPEYNFHLSPLDWSENQKTPKAYLYLADYFGVNYPQDTEKYIDAAIDLDPDYLPSYVIWFIRICSQPFFHKN